MNNEYNIAIIDNGGCGKSTLQDCLKNYNYKDLKTTNKEYNKDIDKYYFEIINNGGTKIGKFNIISSLINNFNIYNLKLRSSNIDALFVLTDLEKDNLYEAIKFIRKYRQEKLGELYIALIINKYDLYDSEYIIKSDKNLNKYKNKYYINDILFISAKLHINIIQPFMNLTNYRFNKYKLIK